MSDSELRAIERMLASGVQSALDGFRQNAFDLTFRAREDESKPAAGVASVRRKGGCSF